MSIIADFRRYQCKSTSHVQWSSAFPAFSKENKKMSKAVTIQEITEALIKILSELDDLKQHVAAVKVAEAITALSGIGLESGSGKRTRIFR